ncbi:MAG: hypothetical protein ACXWZ8_11340, partial [Gaiellaceae bacterium]
MTCNERVSANRCERARTLRTLAMQKVVGSNPIIRSYNPRKSGVFWLRGLGMGVYFIAKGLFVGPALR